MNEILQRVYFHNTVLDYLIAFTIITIGCLILKIFKRTLLRRLEAMSSRTENQTDDFIVHSIERFGVPALYYFIVYSGISYLELSPKTQHVIGIATAVVITFFVIKLISSTVQLVAESYVRKHEHGEEKVKQMGGVMFLVNMVIWALGIVFLIDNLGGNVTTIIAGLGIGGIAVALAAQNILGDLFNYFVIFFDRPFEVGDFIVVDNESGNIEHIGLKTTRIRSLAGEQIVIGNANLTSSRIHNYKRLVIRRILFNINVDLRTPEEKLKIIPGLIRDIVEKESPVRFDRAHLAMLADWSARFEVVYFVTDSDFNKSMDIQQSIYLKILAVLKQEGVNLAALGHVTVER
jgi:small-conductance mechanosensitive channel